MKLPVGEKEWKGFFHDHRYLLLALAAGLCLLLLPGTGSDTRETEEEPAADCLTGQDWLAEEEARLGRAISQIDGAGQTMVMLTLETGPETVLALDREGERQETVILSAGSGYEQTVPLLEKSPRLQGALIVCQGGGNDKVRLQILEAVKALTGLNANQISICKGMGGA